MRCFILFVLILGLANLAPAAAQTQSPSLPPAPEVLREFDINKGGRLTAGQSNVLLDKFGLCRWVDNTTAAEFFVPMATAPEWQAFVDNAPVEIARTSCCPALAVTLTAQDTQTHTMTLPIGREGATNTYGTRLIAHDFTITRPMDGATWTQTVTQSFTCSGGSWVGGAMTYAGNPPPIGCGTYAEGDTWYIRTGSANRPADLTECPDGPGTRLLSWDIESLHQCVSGSAVLIDPAVTRNVNEVWSGECATASTDCPPFASHFGCGETLPAVPEGVTSDVNCTLLGALCRHTATYRCEWGRWQLVRPCGAQWQ